MSRCALGIFRIEPLADPYSSTTAPRRTTLKPSSRPHRPRDGGVPPSPHSGRGPVGRWAYFEAGLNAVLFLTRLNLWGILGSRMTAC